MTTTQTFNASTDIPNLANKVILLTGATAGLGRETLVTLAKHNPSTIYFTGRNASSAQEVISQVKQIAPDVTVKFLQCDQMSLASVQSVAQTFLKAEQRLDMLLCVAGIMALPPKLTKDGYEQQFGVNHMAHALLIKLLLPTLQRTAAQYGDARVISWSSLGMQFAQDMPLDLLKTELNCWVLGPWMRYGYSKLANVLYAKQLAEHYPTVTFASVHPGVINTGLLTGLSWGQQTFITVVNRATGTKFITLEEGVQNGLWAATADKAEVSSGAFYEPVGKIGVETKASKNYELARKLWEWTQAELTVWK